MAGEGESERALVAACVRGDEAAWARFHARFRPVVARAAQRALGEGHDAARVDDVVGDVFALRLFDSIGSLGRGPGIETGWIAPSVRAEWQILANLNVGATVVGPKLRFGSQYFSFRWFTSAVVDVAYTTRWFDVVIGVGQVTYLPQLGGSVMVRFRPG